MRILLIIPNLERGGAQKVVLAQARGLVGRGHEVHILLMDNVVKYNVPAGVTVHSLTPPRRHMSGSWLGKQILIHKLRRWAAAQPPFDLAIASLPFASEIVFRAGFTPVWHHVHNSLAEEVRILARRSASKAARRERRYREIFEGQSVITVSDGIAADMRTRLGLSLDRAVTIYNPFDLVEIRKLAAEPEPDLPAEPYIVHAGRYVLQKRHDILFDAYIESGIPHRLVLLVEDHPGLRELIRSRSLQDRVTIAGFRDNLYPWLAKAKALVLSSDFEGFGNVLCDALACGTPVVSTNCPSGPDEILVGDLARYLSPPGDIHALARNIQEVIQNPPRIDPASLDKFSLERALDRIESLVAAEMRQPRPTRGSRQTAA